MKSKLNLDVVIDDERWTENVDFDVLKVSEELGELVFSYMEEEGEHELLGAGKTFGVNVCLSCDAEVHRLNKEFRGMDKPTNVLSFANVDDEVFWDELDACDEAELGDIILAYETLVTEAQTKGISVYAHYCHLLVHGFLHLLGFDHQEDDEAEEMEGLETEILAAFSIDDPYQEVEEA